MLTINHAYASVGAKPLINDVSFSVPANHIAMIIGPNGAGKSSLLKVIAGLIPPEKGAILYGPDKQRLASRRSIARRISYAPQFSPMNFPLTVRESIELGGMPFCRSVTELHDLINDALDCWDLRGLQYQAVQFLSGGEQQRCLLARSWVQAHSPDNLLWLLDEPFTALDLSHQQNAMKAILSMKTKHRSIVMVVHDLRIARLYADTIILLSEGEVREKGDHTIFNKTDRLSTVFRTEIDPDLLTWTKI